MSTRGRPRTGSLYWVKSGWRARLTVEVDGVSLKRSFNLETTNKAAAKVKLRRLLESGAPTEDNAARHETFREAADRIVNESRIQSKSNRLGRLRNHAYDHIGHMPVDQITAADVRSILKSVAAQGLSLDLVQHIKQDIGAVLGELYSEDILTANVVDKLKGKLPKAKVDTRERATLNDDELARYLAWVHPDEAHAHSVLERQTMACVSRMFGGCRIGDIRALKWEHLETDAGRFSRGWAPRKKTARPQLLEIPEMLRPILRDWWERHGQPTEGPVFPTVRGARAGQEKRRSNVAAALRRDLRRALGIDVPTETRIVRSNGKADTRRSWKQSRMLTAREVELFEETELTKPVDFHSFRRSYKQALAEAGIDVQQSMHLSGSSDVKAHQRYLNSTAKMRRLPAAALPQLGTSDIREPLDVLDNPAVQKDATIETGDYDY